MKIGKWGKNWKKTSFCAQCITYHGVGKMEFYTGSIKATDYIKILSRNLIPTVKQYKMRSYIFQQDGASSHTSNLPMDYFKINNIEILDWSSNSPDLNPIEHIWAIIKQKLHKMKIRMVDELKEKITDVYYTIPKEHIQNLVLSMENRIKAVIDAKGGHTRY